MVIKFYITLEIEDETQIGQLLDNPASIISDEYDVELIDIEVK